MMTCRPIHLLAVLLALCACGGDHDTRGPKWVVAAALEAAEHADLSALLAISLTADQRADLEDDWAREREGTPDPNAALRVSMTMGMLTPEGAEEEVFAQVEPMLEQAQEQLQMASGIVALAMGMAASSEDLSDEERQQAERFGAAMTTWLTGLDITDTGRVKQAIRIVCETARDLDIETIEDLHALEFDQLLLEGGVILRGLKEVLAVYDLDLNAVLGSVKLGEPTIDGDSAKVPMSFTIFGAEHEGTAVLKLVDGDWVMGLD